MKVVDLFAGCGGLALGFQAPDYEVVAAFDNWDAAIEVYRANLPHPIFKQDLSEVASSAQEVRKFNPNIIVGGPPCQDFSHAGKRSEGDRANLTVSFSEIVVSVRVEWFVMENVDRAQASSAFREAQALFRRAGYGLTTVVLDASLCGVPQRRKRLVCVGKLNEDDGFLTPAIESRLARKPMTIRDYFGDELDTEYYYRHPRNYARRGIYSLDEPAATVRGVNRPIPAGYKRHPRDPANPKKARPLTTDERARVQTFPSGYKWFGTKTDQEQMIGNAVPAKLAQFVAQCISDYRSGRICSGVNLRLPLQSLQHTEGDGNGRIQAMAEAIGKIG
jgi:DNA (cytosine-5)-methyltransferase 1